MKKEDEVINVWEKVIELNYDGEVVGYYFQYKKRLKKDQEVKNDEESGSTDGKKRD